jgi:hypothetical protein
VQTSRLRNIHVEPSDVETVFNSMKRLSDWVHDSPAEMNASSVTVAQLEVEIGALEEWMGVVAKRKK